MPHEAERDRAVGAWAEAAARLAAAPSADMVPMVPMALAVSSLHSDGPAIPEVGEVKAETDVSSNGSAPCELASVADDQAGDYDLPPPAKRAKLDVEATSQSHRVPGTAVASDMHSSRTLIEAKSEPSPDSDGVKQEIGTSAASKALPVTTPDVRSMDHSSLACSKLRIPRDAIDKVLQHTKASPAEVVRYRDKGTGKMTEARIPTAVLALLRIRASCAGKQVSDERISRLGVEVMEEQGYDPIRAVASLSPASMQCPTSAMRVLGSGAIGVVFLVEETGTVVKVMLEDFANKEYEVFCACADAGLAVRPMGLHGPQIVQALQQMFDAGLVHGDLHLKNIAVKNHDTQPLVQLIDFGRSARSIAAAQSGAVEALRAGHEYDTFRLLTELCQSYDEVHSEKNTELRACEKDAREIRRGCQMAAKLSEWATQGELPQMLPNVQRTKECEPEVLQSQLHKARQIAGLQAYVADEFSAMEQLESAYNTILIAVAQYAHTKLDLTFDGAA
eukprot:CAMPEP_0115363626 /NCGR_PEP_ID=MMETSP0270-20121206/103341_1 /TAXON_ID=71861 /ORGANISM="Scrippsiella trochoidea, Strain CCMP3099" /LENGTH=504 /DNA_ID=CAMNT_0002786281 /DNA_START=434 /DNA_END=1944 /DNA_ORIENTATION=+